MDNLIDIFGKKPVKHKPAFNSGKAAATKLGANEEITLSEILGYDDKSFFMAKADNDYLQLKANDFVAVNVDLKPNPKSLVVYSIKNKSGICEYSELMKQKNAVIVGVVTHFIRNLECAK